MATKKHACRWRSAAEKLEAELAEQKAKHVTRHYAESQGKPPAELGMKPPSEGAKAPMFLLFGELEGSGRYYGSDAQRSPLDRYRSPGSAPYSGG